MAVLREREREMPWILIGDGVRGLEGRKNLDLPFKAFLTTGLVSRGELQSPAANDLVQLGRTI